MTSIMNKNTAIYKRQAVIDWLNVNPSETRHIVHDINSYDGTFNNLAYYDMDSFNEFMQGLTPMEIAHRIHFGDFNPMHAYFTFDAYANLRSADDWISDRALSSYTDEIADWIIDNCGYNTIFLPEELEAILNDNEGVIF